MSVAWNNGVFSPTYPGEVNPESGTIDEIAAAERRGYERAVARLRDHAAMFYPQAPPDSPGPILRDAADHLDAMKENTDG